MESSAEKVLSILDLFGEGRTQMDVEDIASALRLTRSTCYRYIKSLADRGYLVSSIGGGYALGPQIMNLEFHLQSSDPLIRLGRPAIEELVEQYPGTALICRVFRESFVAIASVQSEKDTRLRQWRGRALPLVRGSTARVIQAFLPRHRIVKLFEENTAEFAELGFANFDDLQSRLREIRTLSTCRAFGEVHEGVNAISGALLGKKNEILGTITFTALEHQLNEENMAEIEDQIRLLARVINRQLNAELHA